MTKWAVIAALSIAALAAFIEAPKIPMWGACSVGVTGTAAKLNYSGWGAEHACQEAAASSGSLYRLKGRGLTSAETVRCERSRGGLSVSVTDTGVGLVAVELCRQVASW